MKKTALCLIAICAATSAETAPLQWDSFQFLSADGTADALSTALQDQTDTSIDGLLTVFEPLLDTSQNTAPPVMAKGVLTSNPDWKTGETTLP